MGKTSGTELATLGRDDEGDKAMGADDADSPVRTRKNKTERLRRSVGGGACC